MTKNAQYADVYYITYVHRVNIVRAYPYLETETGRSYSQWPSHIIPGCWRQAVNQGVLVNCGHALIT